MDWGNITLNTGETVLIRSEADLLHIIRDYLSEDLSDLLGEHIHQVENVEDILNDLYFMADELSESADKLKEKIDKLL